jgi:anti-sigma B factor antagonist
MALSVSIRTCEPGITIFEISGKATMDKEGVRIEPLVVQHLDQGERKFVFDLAGVSYIDSSGMGQLAYFVGKIAKAGGTCRVVGAKGLVLDVFRITRLDSIIPMSDTVEEACALLAAN